MGSLLFLSENSEGGERLHPVRQNVLRTIARTLATMYQLLLRPIGTNAEVQKRPLQTSLGRFCRNGPGPEGYYEHEGATVFLILHGFFPPSIAQPTG